MCGLDENKNKDEGQVDARPLEGRLKGLGGHTHGPGVTLDDEEKGPKMKEEQGPEAQSSTDTESKNQRGVGQNCESGCDTRNSKSETWALISLEGPPPLTLACAVNEETTILKLIMR